MDDFELGQAAPQPSQGQGQAPNDANRKRRLMAVLGPLVATAMARGGHQAASALLQGVQQREQQREQEQMRRQQAQTRQAAPQPAGLTPAQMAQRQQQVTQATLGALPTLDTPESARALMGLMRPQAQAAGMNADALDAVVMEYATPTRMQTSQAQKKLSEATKAFGDNAPRMMYRMPGEEQPVTFEELQRRAGFERNPNAPVEAPEPPKGDTRSLAVQAADALARGDTEAYNRLLRVQKEMGQADDRAPRATSNTEGRNPRDVSTFNQIAGAFERSPLIRAADRTIVLNDAIASIEKNPRDPAAQLALAYSYVQALDTYQSAVREGELQNLGILGTRLQQFATTLNRVAFEGAFLPPEVARNIAVNAKQLVATIEAGRARKAKEFASRAQVSGVGDMWETFVAGSPSRVDTNSGRLVAPPEPSAGTRRKAPGDNPWRRR